MRNDTWAQVRAFSCLVADKPGKIVNVYQPAVKIEDFCEVGKYHGKTKIHEALAIDEFRRLFQDHGMDVVGPPLVGQCVQASLSSPDRKSVV